MQAKLGQAELASDQMTMTLDLRTLTKKAGDLTHLTHQVALRQAEVEDIEWTGVEYGAPKSKSAFRAGGLTPPSAPRMRVPPSR